MAVVIGEALVDVVRHGDGSEERHAGGSPANVAVGLARLGREVRLETHWADDADGELVRAHVESSGATLSSPVHGARTSTAIATLDSTGAATYDFDVAWELPRGASVDSALVVHTGSVAATLTPGADTVAAAVLAARDHATISYDPNARPSLMGSPSLVLPTVERMVDVADVVKASDEDLAWLYPGVDPDAVAASWLTRGAGVVVMTRGGEGAAAWCGAGKVTSRARPVAVVDTVGAGDSFMAALIDGLWAEGLLGADRREALRAITTEVLSGVIEKCLTAAAVTVSRAGANPPWRAELSGN